MTGGTRDDVPALPSDVHLTHGRRPHLRRIRACEVKQVKTVSCTANECRRGWTMRRNEFLKLLRTLFSINVNDDEAGARRNTDISIRIPVPEASYLGSICGGVFETALSPRVFGRRRAGLAAAAGAVDHGVKREYSPAHTAVRQGSVEHLIRHEPNALTHCSAMTF